MLGRRRHPRVEVATRSPPATCGPGWRRHDGLVGYASQMRTRQRSKSVESLTAAFVDRLSRAVEHAIDARTRILAAEWMDLALVPAAVSPEVRVSPAEMAPRTDTLSAAGGGQGSAETAPARTPNRPPTTARLRRNGPGRPAKTAGASPTSSVSPSTTPSPEEQRRDAEFARLRALLKPTGYPEASGAAETLSAPVSAGVVAAPSDPLRLLEDEIRLQAHGLAQLSQASCTARIAAWAGRVRSYEETTGNRVAADLLLDKLRALARAMDAGRIEALIGSWRTSDWGSYIRTNEGLAEARSDRPETSEQSRPDPSGEPDFGEVWSQPS